MAGEEASMAPFLRLTAADSEFLAEDTMVKISPDFNFGVLHFISGDFGPFRANMHTPVPLWLALKLKKDKKCHIVCPEWLEADSLAGLKEEETAVERERLLSEVPPHYLEIGHLILADAEDDVEDAERIRQLLKYPVPQDIEEIRYEKLRTGRKDVLNEATRGSTPSVLQLTNISRMEVSALRSDFLPVLDKLADLERAEVAANRRAEEAASSATDDGSRDVRSRFTATVSGAAASRTTTERTDTGTTESHDRSEP